MYRTLRNPIVFLATLVCFSNTAEVWAQGAIPIPYEGRTIGFVDVVDFRNSAQEPSRFFLDLRARFPNFPIELDSAMKEKGNLGRPVHEIFWLGGTSIVSAGSVLSMTTLIQYKWRPNIGLGLGRKTMIDISRWADWHLFITPGGSDELRLGFSVDNIRGVRNDIERLVGARISRQTGIEIPARCGRCLCSDILPLVQPKVETVQFTNQENLVEVLASISFKADESFILSCIAN